MSDSRYVHIDVDEVMAETEKALLLRIDEEEFWCPLSQIADADNYSKGDANCTISVTKWFCEKNGIEVDE